MALPADRATTLKEAYRACNVVALEGEKLERYYVDLGEFRETEAVAGVNSILEFQEPDQTGKILFAGSCRGCGKSTELKRIQQRWEKEYQVIYLEVNEETDINTVGYVDLYLIVIKHVEFTLRQLGLKFDSQLKENFENWFKEITKETEQTVESSVSVEGEVTLGADAPFIAKLLVKLLSQIKGGTSRRETIRQTLELDISRLKTDINLLLADGGKKLRKKIQKNKGFLIIFDNLDRVPPEVGERLFFDYAKQLQEINCTIIFNIPISAMCSWQNLNNTFESPHFLSIVNVYQYDSKKCDLDHDSNALRALAKLVEQRVEVESVFSSRNELMELLKASGGHLRQLMQMLRSAILAARGREHQKIESEDVEYAINQEQFAFERFIPDEHYPILAHTYLEKDLQKNEAGPLMLYNTSVLEYYGRNRWNYPNPVVRRINTFKRALTDIQSENIENPQSANHK
ncbi:MAG: hypothetical protein AB4050_14145 [Synechococcus sp.]